MAAHLYQLKDVTQVYAGREVLRIPAMNIPQGECLGLAGPNGSGKSTLLRLLGFLEKPASGELRFLGNPVFNGLPSLRRQAVLLDQSPYLLRRSVFANVAYGLAVRGEKRRRERVAEVLSLVGLDFDQFANRSWKALSGGEARRVALAARLVLKPRVLLLDEPTANLDAESGALILRALLTLREEGNCTLIAASHDAPWLAEVADRTITLKYGACVENCRI